MAYLLKLLAKIGGNKIVKIVLEVLEGIASKYLDKVFDYVKEGVVLADNISAYVKANATIPKEELKGNIKTLYNYDVTDMEIDYILTPPTNIKGLGKYLICFDYVVSKLKIDGKELPNVIINLLIEIAVAKFSNK